MISTLFLNLGYIVLFINTLFFLKLYSKNGKPIKILAIYSCVMLIIQIITYMLAIKKMNNLFLSHFYFILQFVILSYFYYTILKEKAQKNSVKFGLLIVSIILIVQYCIEPNLFFKFNLLEIFLTSISLIVYISFYLYNMLNDEKKYYYFTIGLLLYLFGSTIIFLSGNLIISLNHNSVFKKIWDLNRYLYVVYQLLILYDLTTNFLIKRENAKFNYR